MFVNDLVHMHKEIINLIENDDMTATAVSVHISSLTKKVKGRQEERFLITSDKSIYHI